MHTYSFGESGPLDVIEFIPKFRTLKNKHADWDLTHAELIGALFSCTSEGLSGESNRPLTPILLKSIAIHLPFLSRYFCKSMPSFGQRVVYTPPICITLRLPFVYRYFCRSIRVRGRWNTPKGNRTKELPTKVQQSLSFTTSLWYCFCPRCLPYATFQRPF